MLDEKWLEASCTSMREYVDRQIFEAESPKVPCLICGEDVPLVFEDQDRAKICDKCKDAILTVRRNMEDAAAGKPILD